MHHYPFHPGDYMLSTAHLTLEEDVTYRRALDLYYSNEGPLAFDKQTLSKRLRVPEQTLAAVLSEFFEETPKGWRHARCDEEIARYKSKSEKAKLAGAQGGKAKAKAVVANAKRTPSENVANQELEPRTNKGTCTLGEAKAFAVEIGMPESDGEACFHKWQGNGWKNGTNLVKDWKATMRSWKAAGYLPSQKAPSRANAPHKPRHQAYDAKTATEGMSPDQILNF